MDNSAAEQYLNSLFGRAKGYVAVAYKDKGESWQECQFAWPTEKRKLLGWAKVHADANIFVCPALRQDGHTRKKGDAVPTRWLWADVDWDKVPEAKRAAVRERIAEIGTLVVGSGSGDNAHVYVRLNRPVDVSEHYRLNSGLREYLYADAKHADNSLLRLPGSTNWKTEEGSPVAVRAEGPEVSVDSLMEKRTFRNVKVVDLHGGDSDWTKTDLTGVPRKALRWARMPVDQAVAIYGSRHKAVWAVVGDMRKAGLTDDQIHTLMDTFPAALDKNEDEHNGYDVHKDVSRRLKMDEQVADAVHDVVESLEDDEEYDFELADDADVQEGIERTIQEGVEKELLRRNIRRAADRHEAMAGHTDPPPDSSTCLSDALSKPPAPVQWLIQDMCSATANVVIAGQYKTGKTKMMVASLISSLVDGKPFLGEKEVFVPEGGAVVGHWNLEMSELDLIDKYMRPVGYEHPENIHIANWLGYRINLLSEPGKAMAVDWLKSRGALVWTIDSWSQLCRMAGVDPNDNKECAELLGAINEIKLESGVKVCFFLAHTARSSGDSERPGTRGASSVDETVDTRWMLTVDKGDIRYIQAEGRHPSMKITSLVFDEETGRSTLGTVGRISAAADGWIQVVTKIVTDAGAGGINQGALWKRMRELGPSVVGKPKALEHIQDALDAEFIVSRKGERPAGRGGVAPTLYFATSLMQAEADRRKRATPQVVNLGDVSDKPRRRRGSNGPNVR